MNLERVNAGEYRVRDGEREAKLSKGLNRKWKVEPVAGLPPGERRAGSYSEAKLIAEALIKQAGEAGAKPASVQSKRATKALQAADPDTVRLTIAERLHKLADDILAH